jgi:hypothetical protein
MSWNHRVMQGEDGTLAVHEVTYDKEHRPVTHGEPVIADAMTIEKLRLHLASMQRATDLPILTADDFVAAEPDPDAPGFLPALVAPAESVAA